MIKFDNLVTFRSIHGQNTEVLPHHTDLKKLCFYETMFRGCSFSLCKPSLSFFTIIKFLNIFGVNTGGKNLVQVACDYGLAAHLRSILSCSVDPNLHGQGMTLSNLKI